MLKAYERGKISEWMWENRQSELEPKERSLMLRVHDLRKEIDAARIGFNEETLKNLLVFAPDSFDRLDIQEKRHLIATAIKTIVIHGADRISITFRFLPPSVELAFSIPDGVLAGDNAII